MELKNNLNNAVFLLGGHDLEMLEISKILLSKSIRFYDENLKWDNATLSNYKDKLNNTDYFVGIELVADIEQPLHYLPIDHHNENSEKPSSIEQVAELLGIPLTRDQQLVAANDKGYIPALESVGAIKQEIEEVRKRDRVAQGVTEEDEQLGGKSIKENREQQGDITIIRSLTPHFSVITDKLYPIKKLIIYDNDQLVYYGARIDKLKNYFFELIKKKQAFSGGGVNGFFGINQNEFTIKEKESIKSQILKITMSVHSYHIFLFPFSWNKESEFPQNNLTDLDWSKLTERNQTIDYNNRKFFHEFVLQALFEDNSNEPLVQSYNYNDCQNHKWEYKININVREQLKDKESLFKNEESKPPENYKFQNKEFVLTLMKVTLDIYNSGIGIFAFHLENTKYENPYDILLINQFGRRLYPPFLDKHYVDFNPAKSSELEGTQFRELPLFISLNNGEQTIIEEFKNLKEKINSDYAYLPAHIAYFLRNNKVNDNKDYSIYDEKIKILDGKLEIKYVLDDRMFVMCWYGSKQLSYDFRRKKLTPKVEKNYYNYVLSDLCQPMPGGYEATGFYRNNKDHRSLALIETHNSYGFAHNDFWYQYVFVDGYSPSCANSLLRTEQIEKHTYARWVEANSLYGITRYSFVCISESKDVLEKPFPNAGFIIDNFQDIYFKMVSLVLVQRTMVLEFSKEINEIKFIDDIDIENETETKKAQQLYKKYRIFINKVFHREVTTQEQGIELYDMLQDHLRVTSQAKELEKEVQEMHRLLEMFGTNQTNKRMRYITIMGGLILVPNFILTLLNNRFFYKLTALSLNDNFHLSIDSFTLVSVVVICSFLVTYGLLKWNKKFSLIKWIKKLLIKQIKNVSLQELFKKLPKWIKGLKFEYKGKWLVVLAIFILIIYLLIFQFLIDKTL